MTHGIEWGKASSGRISRWTANVMTDWVAEQGKVPGGVDYKAPPKGYILLNAGISMTYMTGEHPLTLRLQGSNLLNTSYREYLDRMRYFADQAGRNINFSINYSF